MKVATLKIGATSSKNLGVLEDYYSPDTEEALSKEIEKPMSSIVPKIISLSKNDGETSIILTEEDSMVFKRYIFSLLTRGMSFEQELVNNSVFAQFLPKHDLRRFSVGYSIQPENLQDTPFYTYSIGIIMHQGNRSFVVPRNGFYYAEGEKNETFIMAPLSPKCAACLFPEKSRFDVIIDDNSMDYFNLKAFSFERNSNNDFIATDNKKELKRLKELVKPLI